ncbi:MAG: WYL domain-containing protein [Deltaproteobacteria bacterium]|nr:WYL domain-containing protein [Deltaproteobacteria bacterium]
MILLRKAIDERHLIAFTYKDKERVAEPHILGMKRGEYQALVFQTAGASSKGGLPAWRRCFVKEMKDLRLLDERFPGARDDVKDQHAEFDQVFAAVHEA